TFGTGASRSAPRPPKPSATRRNAGPRNRKKATRRHEGTKDFPSLAFVPSCLPVAFLLVDRGLSGSEESRPANVARALADGAGPVAGALLCAGAIATGRGESPLPDASGSRLGARYVALGHVPVTERNRERRRNDAVPPVRSAHRHSRK